MLVRPGLAHVIRYVKDVSVPLPLTVKNALVKLKKSMESVYVLILGMENHVTTLQDNV